MKKLGNALVCRLQAGLVGSLSALGILLSSPASADPVIYDNNVTPNAGLSRTQQTQNLLAEDFHLSSSAMLTDFHWQGVWSSTGTVGPDVFTIRLFADAGGLPSSSAFETFTVMPTTTLTTLPAPFSARSNFVEYAAEAPAPIALAADATYWFSIQIVDPGTSRWFWAANNASGMATAGDFMGPGTWSWETRIEPGLGELEFRLTGIPEPSSLVLLSVALAGLGFRQMQRAGAEA